MCMGLSHMRQEDHESAWLGLENMSSYCGANIRGGQQSWFLPHTQACQCLLSHWAGVSATSPHLLFHWGLSFVKIQNIFFLQMFCLDRWAKLRPQSADWMAKANNKPHLTSENTLCLHLDLCGQRCWNCECENVSSSLPALVPRCSLV